MITMIGMTNAIQSEDDPVGLIFIIFLATGNKIIMNITNANAETICIHSILFTILYQSFMQSKKTPVSRGSRIIL